MTAARLQVPPRIVEGDVFKLRLLVQHPMDSGFLRNLEGVLVKRNVIRHLQCIYHDKEVFRVEPTTGTAANPLFEFFLRATQTGEIAIDWVDDRGERGQVKRSLTVV